MYIIIIFSLRISEYFFLYMQLFNLCLFIFSEFLNLLMTPNKTKSSNFLFWNLKELLVKQDQSQSNSIDVNFMILTSLLASIKQNLKKKYSQVKYRKLLQFS